MVHIQDIFKYMDIEGKIDYSKLNHKQKKALRNIIECKTEVMGFNTDTCECCGHTEIHYNSCKNPNCPECGSVDKEIWIHKQERFTLNVNYFHVVFTIPNELNVLCLIDPKFMYKVLFDISAETIKELSKDKTYLGAKIARHMVTAPTTKRPRLPNTTRTACARTCRCGVAACCSPEQTPYHCQTTPTATMRTGCCQPRR